MEYYLLKSYTHFHIEKFSKVLKKQALNTISLKNVSSVDPNNSISYASGYFDNNSNKLYLLRVGEAELYTYDIDTDLRLVSTQQRSVISGKYNLVKSNNFEFYLDYEYKGKIIAFIFPKKMNVQQQLDLKSIEVTNSSFKTYTDIGGIEECNNRLHAYQHQSRICDVRKCSLFY